MKKALNRSFKLVIGILVFLIIMNHFIGWAVIEKTWFEKLWITIVAGSGFGTIGAIIGLVIGGIGLAICGNAVGIAGWLTFGVLGFGTGAFGGSLYTILTEPQNFSFDKGKLSLLIFCGAVAALIIVLVISKVGRLTRDYIISGYPKRVEQANSPFPKGG